MLWPSKYFKTPKWTRFYFSFFLTANQIPNYLTLWLHQILLSCSDIDIVKESYHILLHLYQVDFSIKKWGEWDLREIV